MSRNRTPIEKLCAVKAVLDGKHSISSIAQQYDVSIKSLEQWMNKYDAKGDSAFLRTGHNESYSIEFKQKVINSYLSGEGSYIQIARKYKIPSKETVRKWVLKYNGHEKLKDSSTGGNTIMTKGRKTTFDERVEIVQHCIANNHNYVKTSEKYQVSYQQARNYTVKYESGGVEALKDNRGIRKSQDQMSELERLRAENRILRAEKDRAVMETSFLKKLEEIERRRG
jgi:transposase-like protein